MALVHVVGGGAPVDVGQVEALDDFLDVEDLAVVLGRPAQQAEIVDDGLGGEAFGDVAAHRRALVALAHLGAVAVEDQRDVGEPGRLRAECLVEFEVLGGVGEVIFAADDVGHAHLDVVDDVDEMEDPAAVRAPDGDVGMRLRVGEVKLDAAADEVVEHDHFARRAEAPCAAVLVEVPGVLEAVEVAQVDFLALALEVGAAIAAFEGALVPVQPEPF